MRPLSHSGFFPRIDRGFPGSASEVLDPGFYEMFLASVELLESYGYSAFSKIADWIAYCISSREFFSESFSLR
jgi:hypothetical protein